MNADLSPGWDRLRHDGLLLDAPRLQGVRATRPARARPLITPRNCAVRLPAAAGGRLQHRLCRLRP
jgi:hypothetical protein